MAAGVTELQIVDDEAGLRGAVHVELGVCAVDFDFHFRPGAWVEIDVGLVDAGLFAAEAVPGKFGHGLVLHGVVAAELVVGAAIGGAEINVFGFGGVGLRAEDEADEAASGGVHGGDGQAGDFGFDGAVFEAGVVDESD